LDLVVHADGPRERVHLGQTVYRDDAQPTLRAAQRCHHANRATPDDEEVGMPLIAHNAA
jgi:hypothetical protein